MSERHRRRPRPSRQGPAGHHGGRAARRSTTAPSASFPMPPEISVKPVRSSPSAGRDRRGVARAARRARGRLRALSPRRRLRDRLAAARIAISPPSIARGRGAPPRCSPTTGSPPSTRSRPRVEDAVAAYRWLLDSRDRAAPASSIAGDSAGGGLTVATLLALRERGVPLPAAGRLHLAVGGPHGSGASYATKAASDPIVTRDGVWRWRARIWAPPTRGRRWPRPLFADLTGLPPLLVQVGSEEVLLDDAVDACRARQGGGGRRDAGDLAGHGPRLALVLSRCSTRAARPSTSSATSSGRGRA